MNKKNYSYNFWQSSIGTNTVHILHEYHMLTTDTVGCLQYSSWWIDAGPELKYRPTGFLRSSPKAMLVNSQMVCLLPVWILTLTLLLNICFNSCLIGLTNICTINTVKGNYNHHHHFYWYTWLNYECNRAVFTWLSKGIGFGFGFGFTTPFGWLVYLLWFWFYDSQVKTALSYHNRYSIPNKWLQGVF